MVARDGRNDAPRSAPSRTIPTAAMHPGRRGRVPFPAFCVGRDFFTFNYLIVLRTRILYGVGVFG